MIIYREGGERDRLVAWIDSSPALPRGPVQIQPLTGGRSCLTYRVTIDSRHDLVLRRPPRGKALATAHDVLREARILARLGRSPVPVPRIFAICSDEGVLGAPFFIMEYVDGMALHNADDVARFIAGSGDPDVVADALVRVLADLHSTDVDEFGLGQLSRRTGFLSRQLHRWQRQWEKGEDKPSHTFSALGDWLRSHAEEHDDPNTICLIHGDFRLGNMIHAPTGAVRAVLDWELCTLGHPMADLAYFVRYWDRLAGAALGGPKASALAEAYAGLTDRDTSSLPYWIAFSAWRSAAIAQGVLRRVASGPEPDPDTIVEMRHKVDAALVEGVEIAGL